MDPLTIGMVGAVAAPAIGGVVGNIMGSGDRKKAQEALAAAYAQYANMNIPDTEKMKLALQDPTLQGVLNPNLESNTNLGDTRLTDVNIDPRLKQAQMSALDVLSKIGNSGMTADQRASLNDSRRDVSGDEQSRQNQILQSMQMRGMGGSGNELAARLSSSQEAADRGSQESDRLMAMAQQNALQALSQAGSLGGSIRSQEYGEQADLAKTRDAISQFNAQQQAGVQQRNVASQNQAQAANLGEKQRISDESTNLANQQQQYNKELLQQQYNNQMQLAAARAAALTGQAANFQNEAANKGKMVSDIGKGVGSIAGAYGASNAGAKPTAAAPATTNTYNTNKALGSFNIA